MSDAVDTYYQYVKTRVIANNPSRKFGGIIDAVDWPNPQIEFEVFYLLVVNDEKPVEGSESSQVVNIPLQWVWMVMGADIAITTKGRNRGDRYRLHSAMKREMQIGNFPGFTQKKQITGVDTATGAVTFEDISPPESIRWTRVNLNRRIDKASGLIYGVGAITLIDMSEAIEA